MSLDNQYHEDSNPAELVKPRLTKDELIRTIRELKPHQNRPAFVAISGFGGSGKSTLARALKEAIEDAEVIPVDDFIIGARTQRSQDWQTFDRERLRTEVLERAILGQTLRYQKYNSGEWVSGRGGAWTVVTIGSLVIIEGCSVIHPDLVPFYDYSAWIDLSQQGALISAKQRDITDTALFVEANTSKLWDEVWGPNDKDFFDSFRPDQVATVLVEPQF